MGIEGSLSLVQLFETSPPLSPRDVSEYSTSLEELESGELLERDLFSVAPRQSLRGWFLTPLRRLVDSVQELVFEHFSLGSFATVDGGPCHDYARRKAGESLMAQGYVVRRFTLKRGEALYDGVLAGHSTSLFSGEWCIAAMPGIGEDLECGLEGAALWSRRMGKNLLMINGPESGRSEGAATWERHGEAQEAGLRFLESVVKAHHILMVRGGVLGGPAMGKAILDHDFTTPMEEGRCQYEALTIHTFSRLSSTSVPGKGMMRLAGLNTAAPLESSKKLEKLAIQEWVIESHHQKGDSWQFERQLVPPSSSLRSALTKKGWVNHKTFLDCGHVHLAGTMEAEYWKSQLIVELAHLLGCGGAFLDKEKLDSVVDGFLSFLEYWVLCDTPQSTSLEDRLEALVYQTLVEYGAPHAHEQDLSLLCLYGRWFLMKRVVTEKKRVYPHLQSEALVALCELKLKLIGFSETIPWAPGREEKLKELVRGLVEHCDLEEKVRQALWLAPRES